MKVENELEESLGLFVLTHYGYQEVGVGRDPVASKFIHEHLSRDLSHLIINVNPLWVSIFKLVRSSFFALG